MCDKVSLLQQFISRQRFSCTAVHSAVIRYGRFPWRHIVKIKNFVIHCIHIPGSFPLKELLDAHEPFSAAWQAAKISTFCACFQASDRLTEIPAPAAEMKAENFPQAVQAGKRTLQTASCPPASAFPAHQSVIFCISFLLRQNAVLPAVRSLKHIKSRIKCIKIPAV